MTESDFADGGEHSTAVKQGIIDVTQEQIKSSVDNGDIHSAITQTAEGIKSEVVSKDGIISAINLTSEDATISAKRINLSGDVNITNGQVKINGNVITADNIKAGQIMKEVYSFPRRN